MKINTKETLVNKFIETKELNILIANIYNSYFEECSQNIDNFVVSKHSDKENPIYYAFLEALEIDSTDFEFQQLSKQYHLNEIKKLDVNDYLNNPYIKNIKIIDKSISKISLRSNSYLPYECFLYDELDIQTSSFYKEISKLGYFDKPVPYYELLKGHHIIASINPYEININKELLSSMKGNILILGLGLGYLPYMLSLKDDVSSIKIIEKDINIIDLFNNTILQNFNSEKIKIEKNDYIKFMGNSIQQYDYVYVNLDEPSISNLLEYIKFKKIESNFSNINFIYKNEKSILALLRRYVVVLFEENLEGYTSKDYEKTFNDEDKIINALYKILQKEVLNNRQSVDKLLSDESLKTLATKIQL